MILYSSSDRSESRSNKVGSSRLRSNSKINKVEILGVKIDNLTFEQALNQVEQLVDQGRKGEPKYVVKPNTEIVTYAQKDTQFKNILNLADLAPPDGVGLIIGSRLLGEGLRQRVGGPDLTEAVLKLAEERGYSCYFYGARPHVIERLASILKKRFSKLKISGLHHGYLERDESVVDEIKKVKPDILFVALGYLKQEKWIATNLNKLKVPISIAEGGSFDFISGETKRAPSWMRRLGLEWLFRLIIEPKRIRRQMALPKFLWLILTKRG